MYQLYTSPEDLIPPLGARRTLRVCSNWLGSIRGILATLCHCFEISGKEIAGLSYDCQPKENYVQLLYGRIQSQTIFTFSQWISINPGTETSPSFASHIQVELNNQHWTLNFRRKNFFFFGQWRYLLIDKKSKNCKLKTFLALGSFYEHEVLVKRLKWIKSEDSWDTWDSASLQG